MWPKDAKYSLKNWVGQIINLNVVLPACDKHVQ